MKTFYEWRLLRYIIKSATDQSENWNQTKTRTRSLTIHAKLLHLVAIY